MLDIYHEPQRWLASSGQDCSVGLLDLMVRSTGLRKSSTSCWIESSLFLTWLASRFRSRFSFQVEVVCKSAWFILHSRRVAKVLQLSSWCPNQR